jgi:hypothetical protein
MNWQNVLRHRAAVLSALVQARRHAVLAGDRATVGYLDGGILRQRGRVDYARRQASREPRVFTLVRAPFAACDNRPDNGPATGENHGR